MFMRRWWPYLVMCVLCLDFGMYSQALALSFPSLQHSGLTFNTFPPDSWSLPHISCHKVLEHPSPRIGRALLWKLWRFPPSFGCLFRCHITRQTSPIHFVKPTPSFFFIPLSLPAPCWPPNGFCTCPFSCLPHRSRAYQSLWPLILREAQDTCECC